MVHGRERAAFVRWRSESQIIRSLSRSLWASVVWRIRSVSQCVTRAKYESSSQRVDILCLDVDQYGNRLTEVNCAQCSQLEE